MFLLFLCILVGFLGGFGCAWGWLKRTNAKGVVSEVIDAAKDEVKAAVGK